MTARIRELLKRPSSYAFFAFIAVYAVAMTVIFWGTWSLDSAPVSPDNPVLHPIDAFSRWIDKLLSGGDFIPCDLRNFIGTPYFWQELQYAVPCTLAALGMVFYLRGRGLGLVAAYGAGAAYGLMGYNVTLFSAGHLGVFVWLTYGPFVFGLIDRAVRKGRWSNWVLLGGVLAWAAARQPDIWLIFTVLSFFYGVWSVCINRKFASPRTWAGVGIAAAVLFVCGAPQLNRAIFKDTVNRDRQIAGSTGGGNSQSESGASKERTEEEETKRWDFCTSWSLPPDEAVEFFSDSPKGDSSDPRVSPVNRYKGRIGQRVTIPQGQRARDPATGRILNGGDVVYIPYRQHSLYFGFITCILALAGVFSFAFRRIGSAGNPAAVRAGETFGTSGFSDVYFWSAAFTVYLFCALGGFTPFYRLIYMLPAGDYIRCPVKFVHVLEFCTAALAGFGIQAVLDAAEKKGVVKAATGIVVVLALINVADLVRVDRRFLAVEDITFQRAPNAVAETIRKAGGGKLFLAVDPAEGREAISASCGINLVATAQNLNDPGTRFVLATQRGLAANPAFGKMLESGKCEPAGAFGIHAEKGIYATERNTASCALFRIKGVEPPPPEPEAEPDAHARFLTWLSIAGTCGVVAFAVLSRCASKKKMR